MRKSPSDMRVTIEIPHRQLGRSERAFGDDRPWVVDYDAATRTYYRAVDLSGGEIAMVQGLEPLEDDPQFHQQVCMPSYGPAACPRQKAKVCLL